MSQPRQVSVYEATPPKRSDAHSATVKDSAAEKLSSERRSHDSSDGIKRNIYRSDNSGSDLNSVFCSDLPLAPSPAVRRRLLHDLEVQNRPPDHGQNRVPPQTIMWTIAIRHLHQQHQLNAPQRKRLLCLPKTRSLQSRKLFMTMKFTLL